MQALIPQRVSHLECCERAVADPNLSSLLLPFRSIPKPHPKFEVRCCSLHLNISPDPASIHPASILPQRDAILCPCPRRRNCCPTCSIGAVAAPPLPGRRSLSTTPPYSFSLVRRRDRRPNCAIAASPARSLPRPRDRRPDHANNAPPA